MLFRSERELMGILHALRVWRCFLDGCSGGYKILTDHLPNCYLRTQEKMSPRLVRWMNELELYSPTIEYKPGKENNAADVLSRIGGPESDTADTSLEPQFLYAIWTMKDAPESIQNDWPLLYLDLERVKSTDLKKYLVERQDHFIVKDNKVFRKVEIDDKKTLKAVPFYLLLLELI